MTSPRELPLRRLVVEGLVIVGSILLAFAIDAAWNEAQQSEEETRILESIAEEFRSIREAAVPNRAYQQERVERIDRLLGQLGPSAVVEDPDAFWADLSNVVNTGEPLLSTGAIDGVLESGGLQLLDDVALRRRLSRWRTTRAYYESIAGFIADYTDAFNAYLLTRGVAGALPLFSESGSAFPIAPEILARDPVFESQLLYLRLLAEMWARESGPLIPALTDAVEFVDSLRLGR